MFKLCMAIRKLFRNREYIFTGFTFKQKYVISLKLLEILVKCITVPKSLLPLPVEGLLARWFSLVNQHEW